MLKKYMSKENVNSVLLAIFLVGLLMVLYSAYQYFDIENQFDDIAEQRSEIGEAAQLSYDAGDRSASIPLASSDIALRRRHNALVDDQDNAIKRAGVGIVMIAASWIVFDLVKSRRKKAGLSTGESIEKPT